MCFKYNQFSSHHRKKQWFVQFVIHNNIQITVMVWRSGNGIRHISEVVLRQAQLVLRWVTVFTTLLCNQPSRLTQPPTLSQWDGKWVPAKVLWYSVSGSKDRHGSFHMWMHVWVAGKTVWCLVDTCHTWALQRWAMLSIKHYTNVILTISS